MFLGNVTINTIQVSEVQRQLAAGVGTHDFAVHLR